MTEIYKVSLEKTEFGFGIYFTNSENQAIVDWNVPFYRLPNGLAAPAEESAIVNPGDRLIQINDQSLLTLSFDEIIQHLRQLPTAEFTTLYFSPTPPNLHLQQQQTQLLAAKLRTYQHLVQKLAQENENFQHQQQQLQRLLPHLTLDI